MPLQEYPYWWDGVPGFGPVGDRVRAAEAGGVAEFARRPYDVAIVGAGYTGLAAARHLASVGASVLVLERTRVGWGASSRNGGQVLTGLSLDPATLVARHGEAKAAELFDISLEAIARLERIIEDERIACEYEASGHLQAAWKPAHFDAFRGEQALLSRVFRHGVDLVSRIDQRSELGSDYYHGLLIDERSRGLNPARYVMGLAESARRAGATIAEETPVERMASRGRRWTLTTPHGDIDAADILLATNGYTDGTAPLLRRRLVPIGSYVIATEPLEAPLAHVLLPRRRMAFDSKHFLYYFRVTHDRRLVFGGRAEFSRPTAESTRRAAAVLRRGMIEVFPELANVGVDFAWGGNVAFTRDRMPHAGRLDGAYYAGGYCGHGIAMATYLGELLAKRLADEPLEHPLLDETGAGFAAIPLYNGRPWFLPAAGLYYRLLDILS
ncbi:MAG: FAD-binding oxidoreductase [Acidobacteria bacterium]|nr:FAD-binding oxidoreductase [Acidobacteriota bacterium]